MLLTTLSPKQIKVSSLNVSPPVIGEEHPCSGQDVRTSPRKGLTSSKSAACPQSSLHKATRILPLKKEKKQDRGYAQTHRPCTLTSGPRRQMERRYATRHYVFHCRPAVTLSHLEAGKNRQSLTFCPSKPHQGTRTAQQNSSRWVAV